MISATQHILKQKQKRCFRKEPGFYQLLQCAALHPPLCRLSLAVGRKRRWPGNISLAALVIETVTERKCPSAILCQLQALSRPVYTAKEPPLRLVLLAT